MKTPLLVCLLAGLLGMAGNVIGQQPNKRFDLKGDVLGERLRECKFPKDAVFTGVKKVSETEVSSVWRGKSTFANRAAEFEMEFRQTTPPPQPVLDPDKAFLVRLEYRVKFGEPENRVSVLEAIVDELTDKYGPPKKKVAATGAIWERKDADGKVSVLAVTNLSDDGYIRVILAYGHSDI